MGNQKGGSNKPFQNERVYFQSGKDSIHRCGILPPFGKAWLIQFLNIQQP